MTDTPTLETQLVALCEAHGLTSISVHATLRTWDKSKAKFHSFAHRGPGVCGMSDHHDTAAEAIVSAIGNLPTPAVELAPIGELAA